TIDRVASWYFFPPDSAPALLLLMMLSLPMWQISESLPVMSMTPMTDSCVNYARMLLENITQALTKTELFTGINCTEQNMELNTNTYTPSVCAPKVLKTCIYWLYYYLVKGFYCLSIKESCLSNISRDLSQYYKFLTAQPDLLRVPNVTHSLRKLMEVSLYPISRSLFSIISFTPVNHASTYSERLNLCKTLRGFQVRTITVSRAISYMSSGEHTK
uniref:Interleukin-12 subunit alpha n=1 Tax=Oryzias sinensis TaxID=183150 RepID=A0A8C7YAD9_9TELE